MKIFISWSGERSNKIAKDLADWLVTFESMLNIFVSSTEISKGSIWFEEISSFAKQANLGIIVITQENVSSAWLNFESGIIFGNIGESKVIPLLVDGNIKLLDKSPLMLFQAMDSSKASVLELVKQINRGIERKRSESQIEKLFDLMWPDIESTFVKNRLENSAVEKTEQAIFAESQWVLSGMGKGVHEVVRDSTTVRIAGGTFKTFCDDPRNLLSLKNTLAIGGAIKVLMLHPDGDGLKMLAQMRKDYSPRTSEIKLKNEIEASIDRMCEMIDPDFITNCVRFYRALPRFGLCIGSRFSLITLYSHGHGSSSPCIMLDQVNNSTKDFCAAISRGFDELWAYQLNESRAI